MGGLSKIQYRSKMNSFRNDFIFSYLFDMWEVWANRISPWHLITSHYRLFLFFFLRGENISFLCRKNWKNKSKIWKLETVHRIPPINHQIEQNGRYFDVRYEKHPSCIYIYFYKLFEDLLFKKKRRKNCNDKSTLSYFPPYSNRVLFLLFQFSRNLRVSRPTSRPRHK